MKKLGTAMVTVAILGIISMIYFAETITFESRKTFSFFWGISLGIGVLLLIISSITTSKKINAMSPEDKERFVADKKRKKEENEKKLADFSATYKYGELNSQMVCPHCQTKGMIRIKSVSNKKGISGGKATAALLTGGLSILGTGLSRKEKGTQAHCENCNNTWAF
jgi:hypothetical protein